MITWIRCPSSGESILSNVLIVNILCASISGGCAPNPVKVATALPKNRCRQGFLAHLCPLWIETRHRSLYADITAGEYDGQRFSASCVKAHNSKPTNAWLCNHISLASTLFGSVKNIAKELNPQATNSRKILVFSILYRTRLRRIQSTAVSFCMDALLHFINKSY